MISFSVLCFLVIFACYSQSQETVEESVLSKVNRLLRVGPPKLKGVARAATEKVTEEWILQPLDHFNQSNTEQWWMRYFSNLNYFKPQSPIFIYVGGEWEASADNLRTGHFVDIGKELNAALYYTEHRFYGQSKPTKDLSIYNLQFVHTNQALGDLATFIRKIKSNANMASSPVILHSGSYGGLMVTWFKKTYPNLVIGGWASSAPLYAKVDYVEYNQVAGYSLNQVCGQKVYNRVRNGIKALENLIVADPNAFISKLNLCSNFNPNKDLDVMEVFKTISNLFTNVLQSERWNSISSTICNVINNYQGSDIDAVVNYFKRMVGIKGCVSLTFNLRVDYYSKLNYEYYNGQNNRAWSYQTCTQFGYFQTSSPDTLQPFGTRFPISYHLQKCQDTFGISSKDVKAYIDSTNRMYGGYNPGVTNIYYTHGDLDPWKPMGVHVTPDNKNNVIQYYTHFDDVTSIDPNNDTEDMMNLKADIRRKIRQWLGYKN